MNILITNDDGLMATGLQRLVRALHEDAGANIYVCAPDGQRSATGHGITMNKPMTVEEVEMENVEVAWQTSGLPADCVKIALEFLRREGIHIDMVYSGINHGGNLGTDTLYSGTVAAALEVGTADPRTVLNINTPNLPKEEIKGLRFTRLGPREYDEIFVPAHMDSEEERLKRDAARAAGGREAGAASPEVVEEVRTMEVKLPGSFRYSGTPLTYPDLPEDYDVVANQDGYASISPIHTDLTQFDKIEEIKGWGLG